ncbi:MAG: hypothetical protein COU51_01755 [Parcubacteria group bacterium CG10_big_fil_rev_8_21_14_0_10_36_14]|nr:MAG: hypothetical protein COU51_01755 [Parcubacteria group bacterium CG10_big_fil_rev_8_21_14_0_10_36_14]
MYGGSPEDLIKTISRYRNARGDPGLAQLTPEQIQDAIFVAKHILLHFYSIKPKDTDEVVAYFEATGKIKF